MHMSASKQLAFLPISQIALLLERKKVSPPEVVRAVLERIQELNCRLNAYIYVNPDEVQKKAREAEHEIMHGRYRGPLHGIPIALKDNILTARIPTTAGSKILKDFVPAENAFVVDRLRRAGAILIGKTNLSEFSYGTTTNNVHFGPTLNPWDTQRSPGGSSGGSAAAVAACMAAASLGTDTGGSIRIPSALCGVVGLKPTFGRVSRHGVVPLAASFDHVGPLARSVLDVAIVLRTIAGYDSRDEGSVRKPVPDYPRILKKRLGRPRVGLPKQYYFEVLDEEIRTAIDTAIKCFQKLGAFLQEVSLPHVAESSGPSTQAEFAEATSYHQLSDYFPARADEYGQDVRERLEIGARVLATDYLKAFELAKSVRKDFEDAFANVDAILAPTVPIPAPRMRVKAVEIDSHLEPVRSALIRLNRPQNVTGLPAITVPCGFTRTGLPVGIQIIGRAFDESTVLQLAHAYEEATQWHFLRPCEI
jgi:aspartyl-tRNA(Asn)/glutamyl-tRNA(Gln) amidotransferase subunit A